jgi:hypothetical protein
MVVGRRKVEHIFIDDCSFDEAGVFAVVGFTYEEEALELKGEDEDVVGESEDDMLALGAIVDDVVVHIQILLAERHCQLVDHQPRVQVFFDDAQAVLGVGEIKKGGRVRMETKAEAAGLTNVFAVHLL